MTDQSREPFFFLGRRREFARKNIFAGRPELLAERVSRRLTRGEYLVALFAIRAAQ
ncbi:hypothetical protein [Actinoplanes sp. NPDC051411]|uniref:hypothetical protein n=1 Tax=Actinoplanes sp. NPDC051411 TaxID=3155522 RepID=UPI00342901A4